jgi:hypothetical protein
MSKRKSRLAEFLSRVLKWARHTPDSWADDEPETARAFPRLALIRACRSMEKAIEASEDALDQVGQWEQLDSVFGGVRTRPPRKALYKAHNALAGATDKLTRVLIDAGKADKWTGDGRKLLADAAEILPNLDEQLELLEQKLKETKHGL